MLPQQRDKIDMSSLSEEEQKLFRLYGKLPNRKDLLANRLKERKYFDSGDYALSKAGRAPKQSVGTTIPNPEMVPHAASSAGANPIQIPHEGGAMSPAHTGCLASPAQCRADEPLASPPIVHERRLERVLSYRDGHVCQQSDR